MMTNTANTMYVTREARVERLHRMADLAYRMANKLHESHNSEWRAHIVRGDRYSALAVSISEGIRRERAVHVYDDIYAALMDGNDNRWDTLLHVDCWNEILWMLCGNPALVRAIYEDAARYYNAPLPEGELDAGYGVNNLPYLYEAMEESCDENGTYRLYVPFSRKPEDMPEIWHCSATWRDAPASWDSAQFDWAESLPLHAAMRVA